MTLSVILYSAGDAVTVSLARLRLRSDFTGFTLRRTEDFTLARLRLRSDFTGFTLRRAKDFTLAIYASSHHLNNESGRFTDD